MVYTVSGVRFPHLPSIKKNSSLPSFNDDRSRTNAVSFSLRKDTRSSSGDGRETVEGGPTEISDITTRGELSSVPSNELRVRFPHLPSIKIQSLPSFNDDRSRTNAVSFSLRKDTRSSSGTPPPSIHSHGVNVWIVFCKIFARKPSYDSESSSIATTASENLGSHQSDSSSAEPQETVSQATQVHDDVDAQKAETEGQEQTSALSTSVGESNKANTASMSESLHQKVVQRRIPPPGDGKKIYDIDPMLKSYDGHLDYRYGQYIKLREEIDKNEGGLEAFSRGYEIFGFTRSATGITYREWAPGAKAASLIGDFNNWNSKADVMTRNEYGVWEIFLPNNADGSPAIPHGSRVKIRMDTPSGIKDSIPAWIKYSVQAPGEIPYDGVYYDPAEEDKYVFKHPRPRKPTSLRIYESHVGMSSTEPMINTYANFRDDVLPRIKKLGYNAVQIMAIQEHSYYASFGYHVTNFFAPSSRFGTPDDLKSLIDKAHELGLVVLMDIVHSHASKNTLDGLNMFDGTDGQYFHSGERGYHWMWDSRLFNYGSWEIRMDTPSGIKDSIPAWIKYSVQAPGEIPYNGVYYDPAEEEPMINTYANFRDDVLPRIKKLGYNAVQIMAIQEHSYYASFGYHVTNFFAPSSRFGTPDDLKSLIDKAHELGLVVLMDIVHSHASKNTLDGLNMFDGTDGQYFHSGERGYHWMWDSRLFNYGSWEVLRYLLSNARWWLEEYKFDGFRFDGVTSMMYTHHGLQIVLDSDDSLFGGFNRLDDSAEFFTSDGRYDDRPCSLMVYSPCRTAVVYAAVDGNEDSSLVPIGPVPDDV
ncbi:hypothetical protein F2Q69_00011127 [Brassica cretica]|uniref:Glycosyl hydrolase family 13 catalytic domain-containing protein n=1 Tax=Brassica cretica TaxID=69181 RepID=A0A8S9R6C8_BRACR|nr:hypothetical protein F2Q69_00011127 [Brassica cretica]